MIVLEGKTGRRMGLTGAVLFWYKYCESTQIARVVSKMKKSRLQIFIE